jgi:hypothetical protein
VHGTSEGAGYHKIRIKIMLASDVYEESVWVLRCADRLCQERTNGQRLRDVTPQDQRDFVIEAKAMLERYKEQ